MKVGGPDRKETLMERIVIKLSRQVKRRFRRTISKIKDSRLKTRYMIILHTAEGYGRRTISEMLLCSSATVDRVRNRYRQEGELGLIDRRGDNGPAKINDDYILALIEAVERIPLDYGYRRPTWTQELLIRVLTELTGIILGCHATFFAQCIEYGCMVCKYFCINGLYLSNNDL